MSASRVTVLYGLSLLVGLVLQFVQVPDLIAPAWPMWTTLILAAWTISNPHLPHFMAAVVLGLALDVGLSCVLGEHALALLLTTYAAARLRPRLDTLPGWQRGVAFAAVWIMNACVLAVVDHVTHHEAVPSLRWGPVVAEIILWPAVNHVVARLSPPRRALL